MQCLVLPRSEEQHEEVIESLSLDRPMKSDDRSAIVRFFSFEWIFSELS
jgi:hypothetical protein